MTQIGARTFLNIWIKETHLLSDTITGQCVAGDVGNQSIADYMTKIYFIYLKTNTC